MDYTTLSLADVTKATRQVARDAQDMFGALDGRQLNWKPDASRWSVAQCLQHLLTANRLIVENATDALRNPRHTLWQRLPLFPGLCGRALIRSQAPGASRKYTAPDKAQPAASEIAGDIIQRFVDQHRAAAEWMEALSERDAAQTIMISPFISIVTYSVLDACRLVVAHDHRHVEQARRVTTSPGFPHVGTPASA
jgi:hypothetical protein